MWERLSLSSKISVVCILLSIPYFFIFHALGFPLAGNLILVFLAAFCIPIALDKAHLEDTANFALMAVSTVLLFV
jgi:hypothetical protein